jgi:hypothetical protein
MSEGSGNGNGKSGRARSATCARLRPQLQPAAWRHLRLAVVRVSDRGRATTLTLTAQLVEASGG